MEKNNNILIYFNLIFIVSLIITNVTACKVVYFFNIGDFPIKSGAALTYAFTFLATDIISEIYGKHEANLCVKRGLIMHLFALILIVGIQLLPTDNPEIQQAYETLLGQNVWFVTASLIAYWCSQKWDVFIFHKIREKFIHLKNGYKKRWIWNNVSTISSQIIDTAIYIIIGFGIGCNWLSHVNWFNELCGLFIGQYCIKSILALLDTPIFYFLTNKHYVLHRKTS